MLRALIHAGSRGVRPEDFLTPNVVDGGKPIMRVAARIADLRREGHVIRSHPGTTARYELVSESKRDVAKPEPIISPDSLFEPVEPDFYEQDLEWV